MKSFIVLAVALAVAQADVSHVARSADAAAEILRSGYDVSPEGNYQYAYETSNGISAQAEGVVKDPNSDNPALEVKGQFSYSSPDGTPVQVTYIADENGYQPSGNALPVPPPTPVAILRALEYIAAHPPPVERGVNPIPVQQGNFGRNFG